MFREMRRRDRELSHTETAEILEKGDYGVLATIGENGYPYGVPLNYVYKDGKIYFHGAKIGHKLDNIAYDSRVSFTVVTKHEPIPHKFSTSFESAVVFGTAMKIDDPDEKKAALTEMIKKFSYDFIEKGLAYIDADIDKTIVIGIKIEKMTGKRRK